MSSILKLLIFSLAFLKLYCCYSDLLLGPRSEYRSPFIDIILPEFNDEKDLSILFQSSEFSQNFPQNQELFDTIIEIQRSMSPVKSIATANSKKDATLFNANIFLLSGLPELA